MSDSVAGVTSAIERMATVTESNSSTIGRPLRTRLAIWFGAAMGSIVALLLICILAGVFSGYISKPQEWDVPSGYQGWIVVQWADPDCPPAEIHGLFRVFIVPASGQLCTVSINGKPGSIGYERFYFVNQDGGKTRIPADYSSSNKVQVWEIGYDPVHHTEWYYIGTHDQLNNSGPEPSYQVTP